MSDWEDDDVMPTAVAKSRMEQQPNSWSNEPEMGSWNDEVSGSSSRGAGRGGTNRRGRGIASHHSFNGSWAESGNHFSSRGKEGGGRGGRGSSFSERGRRGEARGSGSWNTNNRGSRGRGRGGLGFQSSFSSWDDNEWAVTSSAQSASSFRSRGNVGQNRGGRGRGQGQGRGRREFHFNHDNSFDMVKEKKRIDYVPREEEDMEKLYEEVIPSGINFAKYENIEVQVSGNDPPHAMDSFETSGLRQLLLTNVRKCKYDHPTPVQKNAIPIVMAGRDLMSCAQTGSGKTAAFLLPIINKLLSCGADIQGQNEYGAVSPSALIISPTRELARQISTECRKFLAGSSLRSEVIYGGVNLSHQKRILNRGVNILIATPGRLGHLHDDGMITYENLLFLVLDEADRMLDMGFRPDIENIVTSPQMPDKTKRQTLMFSATFPKEIQEIASQFMNDYLFLQVGMVGGACGDVAQAVIEVTQRDKREKLFEILGEVLDLRNQKTIIFLETKKRADFIATILCERDFPTTSIHGDRYQEQREEALRDFKSGEKPILVATAVAARGLDIKNVALVINFDLPGTIDEYVHRIGRTGRVGNLGRAISFYDPDVDGSLAKDLVNTLTNANQEVPGWLLEEVRMNPLGSAGNTSGIRGHGVFSSRDIRRVNDESNSNTRETSNQLEACGILEDENWD